MSVSVLVGVGVGGCKTDVILCTNNNNNNNNNNIAW